MRFRHLTSAVAQILLNASGGAILRANDFLLVKAGNGRPSLFNISENTFSYFGNVSSSIYAATSDKVALAYNGNAVKIYDHSGNELTNISKPSQPNFGASIKMTDTKIFISAPNDDTSGTDSGALYVYDHDGSNETKITFPGSNNDYSGNATDRIAVGSGKIAIGSEYYPNFSFKGKVDLMDDDGSNVITIYPALPNQSNFGSAVYFHNDKLYISAPGTNTQKVYEYDLSGNLLRTFDSPQGGLSLFGVDLSFYGSKMAVGAEGASKSYIFDLDSVSQEYIEVSFTGHHTAQRTNGRPGFGQSVELTSEFLFVGMPFENTGGVSNTGMIFQYDHEGSFIAKYDVTDFDYLNNNQQNQQIGTNMTRVPGSYPEKLIVAEGRKTYATDRKVYVMDMDGENLIELPEPESLTQSSSSQYATNIEVSTEGKLVVIQNETKTAYVYDLTTTNEPTSFTLDGSNSTAENDFVLEGNKLYTLGMVSGWRKKLMRYDITTGNLEAAFTTSGNYDLVASTIDVGNGKVVVASGYSNPRRIFTYDIDDTTGSSETIITPSKADTESTWNPCRLAVGNGKIVFGDSHQDGIFYIYNLDGSNEIAVDCSDVPVGAGWGNSFSFADSRIGYNAIAIGNEKIALSTNYSGSLVIVSNLDGSELFAIDLAFGYGLSSNETSGVGGSNNEGAFYIANNKIVLTGTKARVSGNETDGIVHTFDLDGTNHTMIASPRVPESGYKFGQDVAIYDPTGLAKFANLPAVISNIDASYTLTEGQDTVITAGAVDPEGDAITWSFEEVLSGPNYVVVGSYADNSYAGSVYVYDANDLSAQPTKLTAFDGAGGDIFGWSVAAVGDKIVVGAQNDDDNGSNSGSVYVYDANNLSATPTKLTAFDGVANDYFGTSVATTSDKIVVGAKGDDDNGSQSGSVYVYDANDLSAQPTKLTAFDGDASDSFGSAIAVTADKIVVGVAQNTSVADTSGSVYVFDTNDLSAQPTKLTAFDGAKDDLFGYSVAATSDKIIVGANRDDDMGGSSGSVYVYDANDLSAQPTKLTAFDGAGGDNFGSSVAAISGDKIIVGAYYGANGYGAVYVYDANDLSAQPTKLTAYDGAMSDEFGYSVYASDDKIFVNARYDDDNGSNSGSVYVYDATDLSAQPTKLTAFDGAANDMWGEAIAAISPSSALNGVTVSQSDNVFTITPGTTDSNFTLRFKVTDAAGNVTTKTSTFAYDYVNKAPTVSGIVSEYNLTQGQDTVITASATDPEGDAITWSFEEVLGSGDGYVAVTNYNDDDTGTNTGSVYIYNTNDLSAQPVQLTSTEVDDNGRMGETDVVFGAGKVIVGARRDSGHDGAVYVYDLSDLSATPTRLTGPANTEARFGRSVAVHSTNLIVGAEWDPTAGSRAGRVYVYDLNDLSASPTTIIPTDIRESAHFGSSVTVSGDFLFISSPYGEYLNSSQSAGAVYVYDANDFSLIKKINSSNMQAGDDFGGGTVDSNCVSVSGNNLIVGSKGRNSQRGGVYVFTLDDLNAAPTELTAFDGSSGDYFGVSVASTSEHIIVGASGDNTYRGAIYIYDINDLSAQPTKIDSPETTQYAGFGKSVSATEDLIFVGTPSYDAYVYSTSDLSLIQTLPKPADVASNDGFAQVVVAHTLPPVSALNGVTVSQSDNVFTVTPGTADANFTLRITATDSEGNATSVTPTFAYDYVNQAPTVSGIDAAYTLTQGQDTVITASATDPEGDAITWSFEEVLAGSSGYVVVSALGDDGYDGSVYLYNSSDLSATPTKLDSPSGSTNFFGRDFEIVGGNLIVTADGDDTLGNDAGAAFVYDMTDLSAAPTKITAPDGASGNKFGYSVTSSSDKVIISSRMVGKVYVYDANDLTATPTVLTGETQDFGDKVTSNSNYIFVSDPFKSHGGDSTGSVYVYDIDSLSLVTEIEHQASATAYFGKALSASEEKLAVGGWLAGRVYVYDLNNLSSTPETTINGYGSHRFGISVGLSDSKLVVGASDQNKAYVYDLDNLPEYANHEDNLNPNSSFYLGRLYPTNEPTSDDKFGYSVSVNDDNIVIGAYGDNNNTGSTYVYDANDLSATPTILTAFDGAEGDYYGSEIVKLFAAISAPSALNGVTVTQSDNVFTVTPAQQDANFTLKFSATDTAGNATSVTSDFTLDYVNQAPSVTGIDAAYTLTQGQNTVITAAATDPEGDAITWSFEEVLAGSGYVVVNARRDDTNGTNAGAVYVYDGSDLTATPTKLTAFDGAASDYFGFGGSVIANDKLFVTAVYDDDDGSNSGSVYVYDMNNLSATPSKLTAYDGVENNMFGRSISANSSSLVIGTSNDAAYVYDLSDLSTQPTKLTSGTTLDRFGREVYATEDKIYIAAPYSDELGSNSNVGSVYVYDANDLSAAPTKLTASDRENGDLFGLAVIEKNGTLAITASNDDDTANNAGAVYVYNSNDLTATPTKLAAPEGASGFDAANGGFGGATNVANGMDIIGNKLFIGAPYRETESGLFGTGEVFVYDLNDLSATPIAMKAPQSDIVASLTYGVSITSSGDTLYVGTSMGIVYAYNSNDLNAAPTKITGGVSGDEFGWDVSASSPTSALNGVTVTQSDNVFTVTPGQQDATFTLAFKATDSEGNVTSTTSDFTLDYVNQAPSVAGIESSYTLTQGQDTVITAAATDPEGDAITWSFEEVMSTGSTYVFAASPQTTAGGEVKVYQEGDLNTVVATLSPSDVAAGDAFGYAMTVAGDKLAIASRMDDNNGAQSGSVYVYDTNDFSAAPVHLVPSDGAAYDFLSGAMTSNSDKIVAMASSGKKVYVWDTNDLGGQPTVLAPSDASGDLGWGGLEIVGDNLLIGDPGVGKSWIYVYDLNDLSASPSKITRDDATQGTGAGGGFPAYYGLTSNDTYVAVGHHGWTTGSGTQGAVYLFSVNDFSAPVHTIYAKDNNHIDSSVTDTAFGSGIGLSDDKLFVGNWNHTGGGAVYVYDLNDLTAQPSLLTPTNGDVAFGWRQSLNVSSTHLYVGAKNSSAMYAYALSDLSAAPTRITGDGEFGHTIVSSSGSSALNGTTVAQSDNVFTVTPAQQDATFQLTFKATDSEGNVTSVTSDFDFTYVNQAPSVTGIESSYLLSAGGSGTAITAVGTDPEGDAITWSFEEVMSGGGSQIVIGSFLKNNFSGSVFVYENGDLSSSPTEIYPSDIQSGDRFGQEIAVTPSHMAVSTWNGSVYVYDQSDLSVAPTKLTSPEGVGNFGQEGLAINDTHLFVGQLAGGPDSNGVVYVYSLSDLSASPTELSQTGGEFLGDGGDRFGSVVAVDNQSLVVSAPYYDNGVGAQNVGRLYVYDVNDLSATPTIVSNVGYQDNKETGYRELMLTSDKIIVGSSGHEDGSGVRKGAVFVHDRNNLDQAPVIVMGHEENGNFGLDAYSDGDILVVGATSENTSTGAAYVYDMSDLSAAPTKLTAYDGAADDGFGWEVYATASNILIGSYTDDDAGNNSGAVYVYDRSDLSVQPTKLIGQGPNAYFGNTFAGYSPSSSLNGTTVTQSDNVFTVTPGSEATSFSMRFTATDANGNATSTTSDFTVASTLSAKWVVVSAHSDDDNGSDSGSVYVYDANDLSAQPTKLTAFDGAADDNFGYSVAATDDKIFVSAPYDDDNGSFSGSVYVYAANDLSAQPTKLTAFDGAANDFFGENIAATADKIVVGAKGDDDNGSWSGSVYVYDANDLSATPTKLTAFDGAADDNFGNSVAATADKIIVGALGDNSLAGSVYVYDINDLSAQPTKLTAFDGAAGDTFGYTVAAASDKILVASRGDDDNGSFSGSVYVYDINDLSAQPTKLTAFDGEQYDYFGVSVAATADKIIVGAQGDDDNGSSSGSVYVYDVNDLSAQPTKLTAFDGSAEDYFGENIAATANNIVVSAHADDDNGTNSGSVYVYDANDLSAQPTKLTAFDGAVNDYFGWSIAAQ